jgi:sulfite reductase alpha subunit-like flavoprotein
MAHYTITSPDYNAKQAADPVQASQTMTITHVEKIRNAGTSTAAWEITLQPSQPLPYDARVQAGMQIALYPQNSDERVTQVLRCLKKVPISKIQASIPKRDGIAYEKIDMPPKQVLAHTVDLTYPSDPLLATCGIYRTSSPRELWDMSIDDFLAQHAISFDTLVACQPPLANRKYTPSDINPQKNEIRIMVSEVTHGNHHGTSTGYLADLAQQFLDTNTPQKLQGFLDLRKHKLPYHQKQEHPAILLSTGVGVAPHLAWLRQEARAGHTPNVAMMLAGGRSQADALRSDEIKTLLGAQTSNYHYVASPKHVQDTLSEQRETFWNMLTNHRATMYVCGLEAMRHDVETTLKTIATEHGRDGEAFLAELKANKQFFESTSAPDRFYTKWHAAQGENGVIAR